MDSSTLSGVRRGETPNIQRDLERGKMRVGAVEGVLKKGAVAPEIEQLSRAPIEKQILAMARSGRKDIADAVRANMDKAIQGLPPAEQEKLIKYFESVYARAEGGPGGGN
jgi:hypothetical protein